MLRHTFGSLFPVSTLTLGGGGLGMLWGQTTVEECVATVHAAVAAGINLLDLAPRYGDGKAEAVAGQTQHDARAPAADLSRGRSVRLPAHRRRHPSGRR